MAALPVTHTSKVTEEQIDHLGHMNVRYYAVNAAQGTRAVLGELGWNGRPFSTYDVYTRHFHEQMLGTPLEVRSLVLEAGPDEVRLHHELRASDSDALAATFVHGIRALDADGARVAFDDDVVDAATGRAGSLPDYAATRTISLGADLLASAPTLEEALDGGMAMRKPRRIPAEECRADGSYDTTFAAVLTWGGEPSEGYTRGDVPYDTPDGKKMAWAAMENRCTINAWPRLGDRIQSFGAPVAIFDKVTHRVQWAYDLDSGDILNAFEVVSLAFDINQRRPMAIPEAFRASETAQLQPQLLPR